MMKYTYELIYPDDEVEESEEEYDTYEEAEDAALDACSCFNEGGDTMELMGDRDEDITDGECTYRIIEIRD